MYFPGMDCVYRLMNDNLPESPSQHRPEWLCARFSQGACAPTKCIVCIQQISKLQNLFPLDFMQTSQW